MVCDHLKSLLAYCVLYHSSSVTFFPLVLAFFNSTIIKSIFEDLQINDEDFTGSSFLWSVDSLIITCVQSLLVPLSIPGTKFSSRLHVQLFSEFTARLHVQYGIPVKFQCNLTILTVDTS
jgi:hypothetical protein